MLMNSRPDGEFHGEQLVRPRPGYRLPGEALLSVNQACVCAVRGRVRLSAASPVGPVGPQQASELVERIRSGDRAAEEELVTRYRRGLLAILKHSVSDRSAVEDLHQEAFRIILEKVRRGDLREPEKLSGFVCSVARNLAIEHFRQGGVRSRSEALDTAEAVSDSHPDPLHHLLRSENAAIVRHVLDEVKPARYRVLLYRYYLAEEDKEQICADSGMESLQFNLVLHRSRERYRELYMRMVGRGSPIRGIESCLEAAHDGS